MRMNIFTEVVSDKDLEDGITDLVKEHDDGGVAVWKVYGEVALISEVVEKSHPGYYTSHDLQIYMAACALIAKTRQTILLAEPAQGKSFVLFMIAEYAMANPIDGVQYDSVVIYSPTTIVVNQLEKKSKLFPSHHDMYITTEWEPTRWAREYPNALFLFDEGEQLIETNLLGLTEFGFTGLYAMRTKKVFLFTATLDDYWSGSFKKVFEYGQECILEFPTSYYVKTKKLLQQRIEVFASKTVNGSVNDMISMVKKKMRTQPILIFIYRDDAQIRQAI